MLPTFIRGSKLIGMVPSRGCGVCKSLFVTKDRRGQEKKNRGDALGMFQDPLEEGDTVSFSASLPCFLHRLGFTVCLALLTVAQQCVKQLSHPPLPFLKSLDHCWKLRGNRVITHLYNQKGFPIMSEMCSQHKNYPVVQKSKRRGLK